MEDLTYRALHLPLLKVHKPPLRIFDFASMVVLVLSSVFGTSCPLQVAWSLTKQRRGGAARNVLLEWIQVT